MPAPASSTRIAVTRPMTQCFLLALWGVLLGLSYPRPNLWVLAHVALVPLTLLAIYGRPMRRVAVLTYLAGTAWFVVMLRWMMPVTGPGTVAVSFYMGLYPLVFLLAVRLIHWRAGLPLVLVVPLVWVACDYVRGILMSGFPWFFLGHSQPTAMIQIADLAGAHGVSFVVGMTNGLIADVLTRPLVRPAGPTGRQRWGVPVQFSLPLWTIILAGTLGYGAWRLAEADENAPTLRVAVVQTNVPQSNRLNATPAEARADFDEALALSEAAMNADPPPALIVWPETMVPASINDESIWQAGWAQSELAALPDGERTAAEEQRRQALQRISRFAEYRQAVEQFAQRHRVAILVGASAVTGWGTNNAHRYNAAYFVTPSAGVKGRYDKIHRVPFGEYIPWVDTWPWAKELLLRLTPYDYDYSLTPGSHYTVFHLNDAGTDWPLAAPICFEDVISYVPRNMVWNDGQKRVAALANLTNDGWFAGYAQSRQQEQIARFRCVENRVPMARAVNTGVSGMIDSSGRITHRVIVDGQREQVAGSVVADLVRDDRKTLFGHIGNAFAVAAVCVTIVLIGFALSRRLSRKP